VRVRVRVRARARVRVRVRVRSYRLRPDVVQVAQLLGVDVLPQLVDGAPDGGGVRAHVVALVLLHMAIVGVRALEEEVADELAHRLFAVHEGEPRLERVVVDAAVAVEHLEGGEAR